MAEVSGPEAEVKSAAEPPSPAQIDQRGRERALTALGVIILIFIMLASIIAIKTPAYESADEPGHVQNIETLVSGHWYGMNSKCRALDSFCTGTETHQAPLYYLVFAGWQDLAGLSVQPPYKGPQANGFSVDNGPIWQQGVFLHHSSADLRFLLWLRLPNVLLGALTVIFAFFTVRMVSSDPLTPVVGASLVAFLPRFVFISSFVTNDNLVNLLGAILAFLALRYVREPTRWRIAWVGAIFGLLVATKLSALPVGLVIVTLAFMVAGWKRRVELLGTGALAALAVCGWYLMQNTVRYGDPLARSASARYLAQVGGLGTLLAPYKAGNPLSLIFDRVPARIGNTFWYQSGWGQFHWPWPVNLVFWLVLAGSLAGLVNRHVDHNVLIALFAIVVAGFLSVWVVATQTSTYEARYVFVGLSAIAALVALGLERWKLPVRFVLPTMGLIGTLVEIQQNVLAVHWS
jgi:hypothetical protein